jgi:uncharacterized protein
MPEIIILSDTHGRPNEKAFKYLEKCDEIWHGGDIGTISICDELKKIKPLRAVYGNIDGTDVRTEYPEDLIFNFEGVKVYMTHIGGYPGRYNQRAKKIIEQEKPGLFICGHSHILKVMFDSTHNLLHINPGAAGHHGFHQVITMIQLTIAGGEMKNLRVIELEKRK